MDGGSYFLFAERRTALILGPGSDYTEPVIHRGVAEFGRKSVEPAGHAYHVRWAAVFAPKTAKARRAKAVVESSQEEEDAAERARMALIVDTGNHYDILNLGEYNSASTGSRSPAPSATAEP
jgi:hypothetical protein